MSKCDFSGWAIRTDLEYEDERVILRDAFARNGGSTVPAIAVRIPAIPASLYPITIAPFTAIAPGADCAIATRSSISSSSIQ